MLICGLGWMKHKEVSLRSLAWDDGDGSSIVALVALVELVEFDLALWTQS